MFQLYFVVFYSLLADYIFREGSSLIILDCQLLPIATRQLMGDNMELDVSDIF